MNLAVLWGPCSSGVEIRTLASGRRLGAFAVRTPPGAPPERRPGGSGAATRGQLERAGQRAAGALGALV